MYVCCSPNSTTTPISVVKQGKKTCKCSIRRFNHCYDTEHTINGKNSSFTSKPTANEMQSKRRRNRAKR